MITYILKSSLCLALLLIFYHLFLEKEKMHRFNRFFLLVSILFSFLAPLYIIYIKSITRITPSLSNNFIITTIENQSSNEGLTYINYITIFYGIITSLFFVRFIKNLTKIINNIRKNEKIKIKNATIVLVDEPIPTHTFLKYIFINKQDYNSDKIAPQLLTHELTHVYQKHTLDILLTEFLQSLFWINPVYYFLKKAIKLNHEFLADINVIQSHKNIKEYQYLLLNKTVRNSNYYLASNLNYSLTKKRLLMMTNQSSKRQILIKQLVTLPFIGLLLFLFANRIEAQEKNNVPKSSVDGNTKTETGFYSENENTLYYVKDKNNTNYYNRFGQKVTKEGKIISPEQTPSNEVIPDQNIAKVYKDGKIVSEFKKTNSPIVKKGQVSNIPPPPPSHVNHLKHVQKKDSIGFPVVKKGQVSNIPPPPPPVDLLKYAQEQNSTGFYIKAKNIQANKTISSLKKKKGVNVSTVNVKGEKIIKLSFNEKSNENLLSKFKDENIQFYLDGKLTRREDINNINTNDIERIDVKKNKDGSGRIYITSKKK